MIQGMDCAERVTAYKGDMSYCVISLQFYNKHLCC
jgi:hypothetical protein